MAEGVFDKAVSGFNHNIRHAGIVFHVQTEDSGAKNPHIITHVFVGGEILGSKKTSYTDRLEVEDLPSVVRKLMEAQHKEMLRNIVAGQYDPVATSAPSLQPGQLESVPVEPERAVAEPVLTDEDVSEQSLDEILLRYLAGK